MVKTQKKNILFDFAFLFGYLLDVASQHHLKQGWSDICSSGVLQVFQPHISKAWWQGRSNN